MTSNKFEQPPESKKEKREMTIEEIEKMGEEMEEYYIALKQEGSEIKKELSNPDISSDRAAELCKQLELIKKILGEDWEGFVNDIKSRDLSNIKIGKY